MRIGPDSQEFLASIRHLATAPPMTAAEEREVVVAWKRDRHPKHVDALIRANTRLMIREIYKFRKSRADPADLFQEACLGLIRSLDRFDLSRGFRFTSYSIWWWRAYVRLYVARTRSVVWHADRKNPSTERDLGFQTGADYESGCVAMDALDIDVGDDVETLVGRHQRMESVGAAFRCLNAREQSILEARLDDITLQAIGEQQGVSRERVRQLEAQAWRRLRNLLGVEDLS